LDQQSGWQLAYWLTLYCVPYPNPNYTMHPNHNPDLAAL